MKTTIFVLLGLLLSLPALALPTLETKVLTDCEQPKVDKEFETIEFVGTGPYMQFKYEGSLKSGERNYTEKELQELATCFNGSITFAIPGVVLLKVEELEQEHTVVQVHLKYLIGGKN